MATFRLFHVTIRTQVDTYGGPSSGTAYSLQDACPRCGTGAVQIGELRVRRFKPPKAEIFMTLDDEVLVTPELAKEIDARDIHCGRTVRDADTEAPLPWVQLVAEETLPPFADDTTGVVREGVCPRCNRDGYFGVPHVPMGLRYKNMPERHASKDWLATWERFGNSRLREPFRDTVLAAPRYLASERLAELFRSRRVKGLELDPVDVPLVF